MKKVHTISIDFPNQTEVMKVGLIFNNYPSMVKLIKKINESQKSLRLLNPKLLEKISDMVKILEHK